jgi:endoglucanase Acf2
VFLSFILQDNDQQYTTMRGVQFIFRTAEGASWIMFASEPMNLLFDKVRKTTIKSTAPYTGVIRVAYIPNDTNDKKTFDSSTGLRRLIYHSAIYPVGGQISTIFHGTSSSSQSQSSSIEDSSRHATVTFSFATRSMMASSLQSTSAHNLLMLALPHHAEVLSDSVKLNVKKFDLMYKCIKGKMTPIIGSAWSYEEALPDLEFDSPIQKVDDDTKKTILQQVDDDLTPVLPTFAENVYGYGKQVARLAQLAHIADQLETKSNPKDNSTGSDSLLEKATKQLSLYLEAFLSSEASDSLLFDSKMGGLVSTNGLRDKGEDFGNGRYNGKNEKHF